MDFVYTTCEAGKRRTVNHTRARSLASPSRAGPGRGRGRGRDEARRGAARPAGRTGGAVRVRVRVRGRT